MLISEDPCNGTDQQQRKLWEQIQVEFVAVIGETSRNVNGLMNLWLTVQLRTNKFFGYFRMVARNPINEFNSDDTVCIVSLCLLYVHVHLFGELVLICSFMCFSLVRRKPCTLKNKGKISSGIPVGT